MIRQWVVAARIGLKLALSGFFAGGALGSVTGQQQLQYHLAMLSQARGVGLDNKAVFGLHRACGLNCAALVFNNAQAAAAVYRKAFTVAEVGNVDMMLFCNFKYVAFIFKFAADAVYDHVLHIIIPPL